MTEIDFLAIALVSVHCPNLQFFGLNNCELGTYSLGQRDPNSDAEYERRQRFLNMARAAHDVIRPFLHLEEVAILSSCKQIYFTYLIGRCPHIRQIHLGSLAGSDIGDDAMLKVN